MYVNGIVFFKRQERISVVLLDSSRRSSRICSDECQITAVYTRYRNFVYVLPILAAKYAVCI